MLVIFIKKTQKFQENCEHIVFVFEKLNYNFRTLSRCRDSKENKENTNETATSTSESGTMQTKKCCKRKAKTDYSPDGSGDIVFSLEYSPVPNGKKLKLKSYNKGASRRRKNSFDDSDYGNNNMSLEEGDRQLALQLQADFDMEAKFKLTAIRRKGSDNEYKLRKKTKRQYT